MLLDLRETIRNSKPIKYTLIGVITVPFALVGIGSYLTGGTVASVASVNGEPIAESTLEQAYAQQRQRVAQMFGGEIPPNLVDESQLRQQALDQLIAQRVVADEVAAQDFAIGDETLGRAIRERPEFQTEGRFDPDLYRQLLGGSRSNQIAGFEAQTRDETALSQFREGIVSTGFTLASESRRMDELFRQQRTVDAVRFDLAAARAGIEVEEEAIAERFEQNADSYRFAPRAKIAWLELSAATLADALDVSEEDARAWYEANRVTRDASHILFEVGDTGDADALAAAQERAQAAKARLGAGESFADLAGELSDDTGSAASGGSLGTITAGLMVPVFEEALNTMSEVGEVSDPVTSEFGVHLIKLDAREPQDGLSFEDVREEAMASVGGDEIDREFFELRTLLEELAFDNPESLEAASEGTGLNIETSDWIDRDRVPDQQSGEQSVFDYPQTLEAAFSEDVLQEGNNSDLIEIGDQRVIVLRVLDDEGERPKALDDVRETLAEEIAIERAGEALDEKAAAAQQALAKGDAAAAIAEADPLASAIEAQALERRSDVFDPATVAALFAAPAPAEGAPSNGTLSLASGDRLAWRLTDVSVPEQVAVASAGEGGEAADAAVEGSGNVQVEEVAVPPAPRSSADPRLGGVEFGALVESLRAVADIELTP